MGLGSKGGPFLPVVGSVCSDSCQTTVKLMLMRSDAAAGCAKAKSVAALASHY
jgi:hypothetical protein